MSEQGTKQPNLVPRVYAFAAVNFGLAIGLFAASGLPLTMPLSELPLTLLLSLVMGAQHIWRVDSRNTFRSSYESLNLMTVTFAAFFLSPPWFIVMMMAGPYVGLSFNAEMSHLAKTLATSTQALTGVVLAWAITEIDPTRSLDTSAALWVCIAIWLLTEAIRLAVTAPWYLARNTPSMSHLLDQVRGTPVRLIPVFIGYLGAIAVTANPWMVPAVATAAVLMYYVIANSKRSTSLEMLMKWRSKYLTDINKADSPHGVERTMIDAFKQLGWLYTYAIARPEATGTAGAVVADGTNFTWAGWVDPAVRRGVRTLDDLRELATSVPATNPYAPGSIWVWPVDPVRGSYMVASGRRSPWGTADITRTGQYLADSASETIETMYQRRLIEQSAAAERRRARTDPVTGLENRLAITEMLESQLAKYPGRSVVVFKVVLADFQHLIDVIGFESAESTLVGLAERLQNLKQLHREIRAVGRDGDDSFLIVATGDDVDAVGLAELIAAPTDDPAGAPVNRGVWVGAAMTSPDHRLSAQELIQRAGLALERSAEQGEATGADGFGVVRAAMLFTDEDAERERRRLLVRLRLPHAIASGAVRPVFQPQIDLSTDRVIGCEVLARWDDGVMGAVTPGEFVEIADQSQQIERLTLCLLEQALAARLVDTIGEPVPLSINLSARSMGSDPFIRSLISMVADFDQCVENLTFEVAESSLATEGITAVFGIEHLRSLGARVSIGNFGTGYSTLSYLDKLPVHEIKIDRSMVGNIGSFAASNPVVRHLIYLCGDLGLRVVAEGIETAAQRDLLHHLGCHLGQGYLIARPMPPDDTAKWISRWQPQPIGAHT